MLAGVVKPANHRKSSSFMAPMPAVSMLAQWAPVPATLAVIHPNVRSDASAAAGAKPTTAANAAAGVNAAAAQKKSWCLDDFEIGRPLGKGTCAFLHFAP